MKIATAGSRLSKRWRTIDITWPELLGKLRAVKRTGETFAEYKRMSKDEQSARKDVGGFVGGALEGGRRIGTAVKERWLITLDADNDASETDGDNFYALYGCAMAVYSTHSSSPESLRLRWIIPLSRAVSVDEYQALARRVAQLINIETMDTSTYQAERLMYWPSCSDDAVPLFREFKGPMLNPDEILAEYGGGEAWRDASLWPMSSRETQIIVREARRQGDPETKPGIIGKFNRTYDVPEAIEKFLADVYEECDMPSGKPRYTYIAGSSSGGAVVEDDGKFLYSHHATDPAGGQLCSAFDLVRIHKFGDMDIGHEAQEINRRPSYKAMCELAAADEAVRANDYAERMESVREDFGDMGEVEVSCEETASATRTYTDAQVAACGREPSDTDCAEACDATDDSWINELKVNHKTGEVDPTIANAELILKNDPRLKGAVAVNRFTARMVVRRKLPWRERNLIGGEDMWTDADEANLLLYLEKYWHLSAENKIRLALAVVAEENSFHPVVEYLDGLKWDGVERLDTMIVRWMGAEDTEYVRAVTRKWLVAGVARMYEPGRKADQMLMLVGPQGSGKSRLAYALAKGRWFTDSLGSTDGKEAFEGLRGKWIVEFAELAATRKSEVESVKNFITKQEDTYRPAYGRNVVTYPRQCIFYGTTNDQEFLRDRTGNRRFWPIEIAGINNGVLEGLDAEVDQLWAEAKWRYELGETLWLDDKRLQEAAREQQERFTEQDEMVGIIEEYLDTKLPANWGDMSKEERRDYFQGGVVSLAAGEYVRERVCLMEIRNELLKQDVESVARSTTEVRRLAAIMNNMRGWKSVGTKKFGPYGAQKAYYRVGTNGRDVRTCVKEEELTALLS